MNFNNNNFNNFLLRRSIEYFIILCIFSLSLSKHLSISTIKFYPSLIRFNQCTRCVHWIKNSRKREVFEESVRKERGYVPWTKGNYAYGRYDMNATLLRGNARMPGCFFFRLIEPSDRLIGRGVSLLLRSILSRFAILIDAPTVPSVFFYLFFSFPSLPAFI